MMRMKMQPWTLRLITQIHCFKDDIDVAFQNMKDDYYFAVVKHYHWCSIFIFSIIDEESEDIYIKTFSMKTFSSRNIITYDDIIIITASLQTHYELFSRHYWLLLWHDAFSITTMSDEDTPHYWHFRHAVATRWNSGALLRATTLRRHMHYDIAAVDDITIISFRDKTFHHLFHFDENIIISFLSDISRTFQ